jgi:hypothetical protein
VEISPDMDVSFRALGLTHPLPYRPFFSLHRPFYYYYNYNCCSWMFLMDFAAEHPDRQLIILTPQQDLAPVWDAKAQLEATIEGGLPEDFLRLKILPKPRDDAEVV